MSRMSNAARWSWLAAGVALAATACGSSSNGDEGTSDGGTDGAVSDTATHADSGSATDSGKSDSARPDGATDSATSGDTTPGGDTGASTDSGSSSDSGAPKDSGAPPADSGTSDTGTVGSDATSGGLPAGWLYTKSNKVYVSDGSGGGSVWVGRGVNMDDLYLCGYDNTLWMTDAETTLDSIVDGLLSAWKPTFVRVSLGMDTYPTISSWVGTSTYKTSMTNVVEHIGATPGVYVLVTLRSDASMIGEDTTDGDPEATGIPSDSTTTPDKTKYPSGTDATYVALVDSFAHDSFVLFGLTNEPGGNKLSNSKISAAMSHAVGVIRAEEDKLGVPHHIVSVQGNDWTSSIGFYSTTPLTYDNVVYEVHGYPPAAASYTYSNIPVILGEYGSLTDSTTFYSDVESKQIPNLAWDFEPYSDCDPDLLTVTHSTTLTPTTWGTTVKAYLLAHAP